MNLLYSLKSITPTSDQKEAFEKISSFLESDSEVFILKGYAGTGKTTLLQGLVDYLRVEKKPIKVLAPTGRAAKVLRDKTGEGQTIHRGIYNLDKFETIDDDTNDVAGQSFHYHFPILQESDSGRICIVDESSMISDVESRHELFTFGTDRLLADLLTYMRFRDNGNKLILVGDPAQLEPVTDSDSKALMEEYFKTKNIKVDSFILEEVVRQESKSNLLQNATQFRKLLEKEIRSEVVLEYGDDVIRCSPLVLTQKFLDEFPHPKIGDGVIINYSNRQCLSYNQSIRAKLFPESPDITKGDLLMINKNNYSTYGIDLYNGTMAEVVWASSDIETQSAPVYVNEGGEKVKKNISLTFRDVKIKVPEYSEVISCKIIDTLLNSPAADLTIDEMKALYINFVIRLEDDQKERHNEGIPKIEKGSQEFKELLENDPYFNALRVKYGYAITGHKSQGGEWDTTFVNFQGRIGLKDPHLRWCYTAMTRAANKMYAINPPNITTLGALHFLSVSTLGKLPADAIQYNNVPHSPYHSANAHPAKSLKFFEIDKKLAATPFSIDRVESRDYHEMYFVSHGDEIIRLDATHNQAGVFKNFVAQNDSEYSQKLEDLFNRAVSKSITVDYEPSNNALENLYNSVQLNCGELDINITNVVEELGKYYVIYYLQIDEVFAAIQFYLNQNQQFTKACPKIQTGKGEEIEKFENLIRRIS